MLFYFFLSHDSAPLINGGHPLAFLDGYLRVYGVVSTELESLSVEGRAPVRQTSLHLLVFGPSNFVPARSHVQGVSGYIKMVRNNVQFFSESSYNSYIIRGGAKNLVF